MRLYAVRHRANPGILRDDIVKDVLVRPGGALV